jgi:predicted transcriptional regulator of viral defense system
MAARPRIRSARGRDRLALVLRATHGLVGADDVVRALRVDRLRASQLLARWAEQGWLKRLRQGVYASIPIDAVSSERTVENPWTLVPTLFAPGYVGGWSAAERHELTEQIFGEVCVFTAHAVRSSRQSVEGVTFALFRLSEEAIFGTEVIWDGSTRIQLSDVHRTLVDMLARPVTGGGIRHVDDCLDVYLRSPRADLDRVIAYADRLGNGAVLKRLGFLLSRRPGLDAERLDAIAGRLTTGYAKLDAALACTRLITRWRLFVPVGFKDRKVLRP